MDGVNLTMQKLINDHSRVPVSHQDRSSFRPVRFDCESFSGSVGNMDCKM